MYLSDRVAMWQSVLVVPYGHNLSFGLWSQKLLYSQHRLEKH